MNAAYWCERAWLGPGEGVRRAVSIDVAEGRITDVTPDDSPGGRDNLAGLVVPGFGDAHSHAFHRALRGRTHAGAGSFWTWREQMYALADRLDPDSYHALARAAYSELALAGVSTVGEFHYLHHGPGGAPYDDPNAMGHALVAAAREAGLRITILDACYLTGGIGAPLQGVQLRFGDGAGEHWATRADALADAYAADDDVVVGAAVHSVRAVPADQVPIVVEWAAQRSAPLHVHVSEQLAENDACRAAYGRSPTEVLHAAGALGPRTTVVHATHPSAADIGLIGGSSAVVCLCPTTERELADGIGPGRRLHDAGSPVALGSDSLAVVDPFEQMRAVEMHERLATGRRGHWSADELLVAATSAGQHCLGWPDAGVLAPGARADLVNIRLDSIRTAGTGATADSAVFAATAADVSDVLVGGHRLVTDGRHCDGDIGAALTRVVDQLWGAG